MKKALFLALIISLPALALPDAKASQALVRRIIGYTLKTYKNGVTAPDRFEATAKHPEDFAPEYFRLMVFACSKAQPDVGGERWQWESDINSAE